MSISGEIDYWKRNGELFELVQQTGAPPVRRIVVSNEVNDLLLGPWGDAAWEERCGELQQDLDHFVEGRLVTVAEKPYKGKTAYMLRLHPAQEEIWEIRSRDPKPGIRILGCFADTDIFVALTWAKRAELKGPQSRQWRDARIQCKTKWTNLFRPYTPKSGDHLHDYISTNAVHI